MADDEAAIQAKIDNLQGLINRHKQQYGNTSAQQAQPQQTYNAPPQPYRGNHNYNNHWSPYPAPRGRGRGRGGYAPTFQNRKIVNATTSAMPTPPASSAVVSREMEVLGIRFIMSEDGKKLTRVDEPSETSPRTPQKAVVHGVEYFRTKNGNLIRPSKKPDEQVPQCEHFIKNGSCPFGIKCRFRHDPEKVSVCKVFFRTGSCHKGEQCDLSHKPTYNRVPACAHFLNGNCTKDACRYAHDTPPTPPGPLVCRPFALLGYCEKGTKCEERHVIECPDYAEHDNCTNTKCKLPHVRYAHVERQKARADEDSEIEEVADEINAALDDLVSDDNIEDAAMRGSSNEIVQNQDFIPLS